jgi:hypothetical protein
VEGWVGSEEGWVGSEEGWVGSEEGWVGSEEGWVGSDGIQGGSKSETLLLWQGQGGGFNLTWIEVEAVKIQIGEDGQSLRADAGAGHTFDES